MNIGESNDLNTVLRYFLQVNGGNGRNVTEADAQRAAENLAERAYSSLSAGLNAHDVTRAWPLPSEPHACPRCGQACLECT